MQICSSAQGYRAACGVLHYTQTAEFFNICLGRALSDHITRRNFKFSIKTVQCEGSVTAQILNLYE